ncbi:DUF2924 domain-containing protein [Rhodoblastus sp.]|uniref:DUF2924 domain-containing protein n=1 Tax=Rhodoblastus sp. TaxID=1962975 RepID=UPI003F9BF9E0
MKIGAVIVREFRGELDEVFVAADGFASQGKTYASLSAIAKKITGTHKLERSALLWAAGRT